MKTNLWDGLSGLLDGVGALIGIASLVLGALAALCALWGLRALIRRLRQSTEVVTSWPRAEGVIVEVRQGTSFDGAPQDHAVYEFRTEDGRLLTGVDDEPVVRDPRVGDAIGIAYDPEDARTAHPIARIRRRIGGWLVAFVVLEVLLFGCAALLIALGIDALV